MPICGSIKECNPYEEVIMGCFNGGEPIEKWDYELLDTTLYSYVDTGFDIIDKPNLESEEGRILKPFEFEIKFRYTGTNIANGVYNFNVGSSYIETSLGFADTFFGDEWYFAGASKTRVRNIVRAEFTTVHMICDGEQITATITKEDGTVLYTETFTPVFKYNNTPYNGKLMIFGYYYASDSTRPSTPATTGWGDGRHLEVEYARARYLADAKNDSAILGKAILGKAILGKGV